MDIQKVKHIRTISTNSTSNFAEDVNELLKSGDYVLLQIGSEVTTDNTGRVLSPTIAVLGSEKPAPEPPRIEFHPTMPERS